MTSLVMRPLRSLWTFVSSFSYIGMLLLYAVVVCLSFTIILMLVVNYAPNDRLPEGVTIANLDFLNSLFVIVSAYSASGLSTVDYSNWSTGALAVMAIVMELGSIVLLTTLPSIIRYIALRKERSKLIKILTKTGAYANEDDWAEAAEERRNQLAAEPSFMMNGEMVKDPSAVAAAGEAFDAKPQSHNNGNVNNAHHTPTLSPRDSSLDFGSNNHSPSASKSKRANGSHRDDRRKTMDMIYGGIGSPTKPHSLASPPPSSSDIHASLADSHHLQSHGTFPPSGPADQMAHSQVRPQITSNGSHEHAPLLGSGDSKKDFFAASTRKKPEDEKEEEDDEIVEIPVGQCIVFEDGLANVHQQMDVCLIIIFGCIFYWTAVHVLFILLVWIRRDFGWSVFHVISAFNNAGFALSTSNMGPIKNDNFLIIVFTICMPLGNVLFPVFFRFQMSLLHRFIRRVMNYKNGKYQNMVVFGQTILVWKHSVRLFLRHPRMYYTHMFGKKNTLVLFLMWLFLTFIGFIMFVPYFNEHDLWPEHANVWDKIVISLFQTVTVRTTGFAIMNLDAVIIGHLAWWVFAMYVSAYPFILTERLSANKDEEEEGGQSASELAGEASNVVGRDLLWLYLSIIVITFAEHSYIDRGASQDYSLFLRVVFEVSSAFGNVGLSLAMPNAVVSFSGSLQSKFSIFMVVVVMYCGKHRGLPRSVDAAINVHVRKYIVKEEHFVGGDADAAQQHDETDALMGINGPTGGGSFHSQVSSHHDEDMFLDQETLVRNSSIAASAESMQVRKRRGSLARRGGPSPPPPPFVSPLRKQATYCFEDVEDNNKSFGLQKNGENGPDASTSSMADLENKELFRARVQAFYEHYNPARLPQLERIVQAFEKNPNGLLRNLAATYGPEPGHSKAMSAHSARLRLPRENEADRIS